MFAQSTLNRGFLVAAATASVCCGSLVMSAPSYAAGFEGFYDPANWSLTDTNILNSNLDTSNAPTSVTLTSIAQPAIITGGNTSFSIDTEVDGILSFNWLTVAADPGVSQFEIFIDNALAEEFTFGLAGSGSNGSFTSGFLSAGTNIDFLISTNLAGQSPGTPASLTISNFSAPTLASDNNDDPVIPTPAMLPGLVGMWMAAMRKKRQQKIAKEEVNQ